MSSLSPVRRVRAQLAETIRHADRRADVQAETRRLLASVHLSPTRQLLDSYPHELSGGMRQRVIIALALAVRPRLLVADEPTTALDASVQASILDLFGELRREQDLAVVMISHDIAAIAASTDRTVVMYAGRVVESGATAEVISRPRHPYTVALLAAMPDRTPPGQPLPIVPGQPPQPADILGGCAFAARCPSARPECATRTPEFSRLPDGRQVACLLHEQPASLPGMGRPRR
jgi:peptide/nickel transport system ATP-binding protein